MGLFVTFEGIDGCGKSTQIKLLYQNLIEHNYPVILTREPGGTPISEKIRNLILGRENSEMSDKCELLLYLAARAQHVDEKIRPETLKGKIVLSDRFEEATFAYQGYGRDIGLDVIRPLNDYATGGITPDLTFILDISPEVSKKRFLASGKIRDRLELNDTDFFGRIRLGYKKRIFTNPLRIIEINGELPIEEIGRRILSEVVNKIKSKHLNVITSGDR
jgi:dTMP kinase